jgi:phospholipid/cholesterol/gamma-HCH transport system permease protein
MDEQHKPEVGKGTAQSPLQFSRAEADRLVITLSGDWRLGSPLPPTTAGKEWIEAHPGIKAVTLDAQPLQKWDSSLLIFLVALINYCKRNNIEVQSANIPVGLRRLLSMATALPERKGARKAGKREPLFERVGEASIGTWQGAREMVDFLGEAVIAFARMLTGRARFRRTDLVRTIQESGAQALPIVSLISVLVGLIFAFVGAIQLRMFGAQIYVASLVGIAMIRVMGAVMTGIIMAGRTGAAFAAQLGTMQTNEEIDALKTLGISPVEFLVLPRMTALIVMMPLLTIYADLMGVLGGFLVAVGMLDITPVQYYLQTKESVRLANVWIGLFHSAVFGVLVALAGCLRGIQCGRSASAVGEAATSAVVTGIVWIIAATALITYACEILRI